MKEMRKFSLDKILLWIQNDEYSENVIDGSAKDLLVQYNNWAESSRERKHTLTTFGRDLTGLSERDIGIEKKKKGLMMYSIKKDKVLEYLTIEELC